MNVNFKTPIPSSSGSPFNQINIDHLIERERKRSIVLIEDIYAQQVLDEARKFYK